MRTFGIVRASARGCVRASILPLLLVLAACQDRTTVTTPLEPEAVVSRERNINATCSYVMQTPSGKYLARAVELATSLRTTLDPAKTEMVTVPFVSWDAESGRPRYIVSCEIPNSTETLVWFDSKFGPGRLQASNRADKVVHAKPPQSSRFGGSRSRDVSALFSSITPDGPDCLPTTEPNGGGCCPESETCEGWEETEPWDGPDPQIATENDVEVSFEDGAQLRTAASSDAAQFSAQGVSMRSTISCTARTDYIHFSNYAPGNLNVHEWTERCTENAALMIQAMLYHQDCFLFICVWNPAVSSFTFVSNIGTYIQTQSPAPCKKGWWKVTSYHEVASVLNPFSWGSATLTHQAYIPRC